MKVEDLEKMVISRWQFNHLRKTIDTDHLHKPKGSLEKFLKEVMNIWVEPKPKIQAKHIPDAMMLKVIKQLEGVPKMFAYPGGISIYEPQQHTTVMISDICNLYPSIPPKVILAKLRTLEKRGLIDGCACGCRGDFKVIEKDKA